MRFKVVLILLIAILLAGCEPEFLDPSALDAYEGRALIASASYEIDALVVEHQATIAEMNQRIAASEEQLAFDTTRAKRQLVGKSDTLRRDVDSMIDVHIYDALSELARARARIGQYDEAYLARATEAYARLAELDPNGVDEAVLDSIVESAGASEEIETVETVISTAQETSVRASGSIENELNKIRG